MFSHYSQHQPTLTLSLSSNKWIEGFQSGWQQALVVEGMKWDFFSIHSEVQQGSVLGHHYSYINNLPDQLTLLTRLCQCHHNDTVIN